MVWSINVRATDLTMMHLLPEVTVIALKVARVGFWSLRVRAVAKGFGVAETADMRPASK